MLMTKQACTRSDRGIIIFGCIIIVDAENREFEGKDEMYTPSTHILSDSCARQDSEKV